MLLERSELMIKKGLEEEFMAAMNERGIPLLSNLPGVESVSLGRGVENPDKFMLLVEWATMDDHTAFTKAPTFPELLAILRPFSQGGSMEHFVMQ